MGNKGSARRTGQRPNPQYDQIMKERPSNYDERILMQVRPDIGIVHLQEEFDNGERQQLAYFVEPTLKKCTAKVGPNDHVLIRLGYQRNSKLPRGVVKSLNRKTRRWLVKLTNGRFVKVLRSQMDLCPIQKGVLCKLNKAVTTSSRGVPRGRRIRLEVGFELIPCEFQWNALCWNCLCLKDNKMYLIKTKRLTFVPDRELSEVELNQFLLAKAKNLQGQTIYEPIIGEANTHWQKQTEPEEKEENKLYTYKDWAVLADDGILDEECVLRNIDIMFRGVIGLKKILDEIFSGELPEVISFMLAEFTFEQPERKTSKAALRTLGRLAAISDEDSPVHQRVDTLFQHSMLAFSDEAGGSDVFSRHERQVDVMENHFVRGIVFNYGLMYSFSHVYSKILDLKKLGHSHEFKLYCKVLRVCLQVELKQLLKEKSYALPESQRRTTEEIEKSSQEPMRIIANLIFGNTGKEMNQVFRTLQTFMPHFPSQRNSFLCYVLDELNDGQTRLTNSQLKRFLSVVNPEMAQRPKPVSVREQMRLLRKKKKQTKTQKENPSEVSGDEKLINENSSPSGKN